MITRNYLKKNYDFNKMLNIRFWIDVNKLKTYSRMSEEQFSLAHKIYENFITRFDSPVRDELNTQLCNNMRLFLHGSSVSFTLLNKCICSSFLQISLRAQRYFMQHKQKFMKLWKTIAIHHFYSLISTKILRKN